MGQKYISKFIFYVKSKFSVECKMLLKICGFPFTLNPNRISFRNETTVLTTFDRYNFHTIIKEFSVVVNTKKLKCSSVTKVTPSSLPFRNILVIDNCCARANKISYINVFLKFVNLIIFFLFF